MFEYLIDYIWYLDNDLYERQWQVHISLVGRGDRIRVTWITKEDIPCATTTDLSISWL